MGVGKKIKEERKKLNMTHQDLAFLLGVEKSCVVSWEQEKTVPEIQTRVLIGEILGISLDVMLNERKTKVENKTKDKTRGFFELRKTEKKKNKLAFNGEHKGGLYDKRIN